MITVSVCDAILRQHNGQPPRRTLNSLILHKYGSDFMIAYQKPPPYSGHFIKNDEKDVKMIQDRLYVTKWYCFAGNLQMNINVICHLNMKFYIAKRARFTFYSWLVKMYNEDVPQEDQKKIFNSIVDFMYGDVICDPPKMPLTAPQIKQSKYKYLILSDQNGGMATCGVCVFEKLNPIILLRDWQNAWWSDHRQSKRHQANVQKIIQ